MDDFAYEKRHTYGIIIVNEENHEPITLLDGRNRDALRNWLKNNKHIIREGIFRYMWMNTELTVAHKTLFMISILRSGNSIVT